MDQWEHGFIEKHGFLMKTPVLGLKQTFRNIPSGLRLPGHVKTFYVKINFLNIFLKVFSLFTKSIKCSSCWNCTPMINLLYIYILQYVQRVRLWHYISDKLCFRYSWYSGREMIQGYECSDLDKINDYCMKVYKNLNSAYGHIEVFMKKLKIRKYVHVGNGGNAHNIFIFQRKLYS